MPFSDRTQLATKCPGESGTCLATFYLHQGEDTNMLQPAHQHTALVPARPYDISLDTGKYYTQVWKGVMLCTAV